MGMFKEMQIEYVVQALAIDDGPILEKFLSELKRDPSESEGERDIYTLDLFGSPHEGSASY